MTLQQVLPMPELTGKRCPRCEQTKPTTQFGRNGSRADGLAAYCRACVRSLNSKRPRKPRAKASAETLRLNQRNYARKWRESNPERWRDYGHRRRARERTNGVYVITPKDLARVYGAPCWACGATEGITLDHVVPIARGGHHSIGNALPLCLSCNSSKNSRLLSEWRYRDKLTKRKAA